MKEKELEQGRKPENAGIFVAGFGGKEFPKWLYHDLFEPVVVRDTEEQEVAKTKGWHEVDQIPITSKQHLVNWRHDLEDMTSKQLVLFAREEFGVDLPVDATEEQLVKAMWQLTHLAPQHNGRVTLLAQTVEMDYDEICNEIYKMADGFEFSEKEELTL